MPLNEPYSLRADVWLAQDSPDPEIRVIGVPWAADSRADLAPLALRDQLHRFSTSADEWGVDLSEVRVRDEGNWAVTQLDEAELVETVATLASGLPDDPLRIYLGGDRKVSEVGGVSRVGFDRNIDPSTSVTDQLSAGSDRYHVSVDLAVLDRVFAPGAPEARPGGLFIRPLAEAIRHCARRSEVVSFDFVGVDPTLDEDGLTLDATAHLLLSAVAGYRERD